MPAVRQFLASGGDERLKIWIYFKDHGEESAAALKKAFSEIKLTERTLKRRLNRSRGALVDAHDLPVHKAYLGQLGSLGLRLKRTSKYLNAVSAEASAEQIRRLNELPFVSKIDRVHTYRRGLAEEPIKDIDIPRSGSGTPQPWDQTSARVAQYGPSRKQLDQINVIPLHDRSLHGEGVLVAILDTGFNRSHDALDHLDIVAEWDFIFEDSITKNQPDDVSSQHDHGTRTLSVLSGHAPGVLIGPAWQASFILAKTERVWEEVIGEEDDFVRALEWAEGLGADVVSSSLGYSYWYTYEDIDGNTAVTTIAADIAAAKGVTVVTAAGNKGPLPWPGIIAPSDGDSVIAVGAVDSFGVVTTFSSRGPTYDGRTKPDVMAMGAAVVFASSSDSLSYGRGEGTSYAAPLVAGSAALLLQAHPQWTPVDVINALHREASNSLTPDNDYGWGIIDVYASALSGVTNLFEAVVLSSKVQNGVVTITVAIPNAPSTVLILQRRERDNGAENSWSPFHNVKENIVVDSVTSYVFTEKLPAGVFQYRVQLAWDPSLVSESINVLIPYDFFLGQSYPNPFVSGHISPRRIAFPFTLGGRPDEPGEYYDPSGLMDISLVIYDVTGARIRVLEKGVWAPGGYVSNWNGLDERGILVSSGVYYYKLSVGELSLTRKLVFIR